MNLVDCRWLFRIKHHPDGSTDRYKACLVANGFTKCLYVDYDSNFSLVVKPTTICLVLTIATQCSWPIYKLDVNNAFLQSYLEEVIYMMQPTSFEDLNHSSHVCKLNKAMYGLKQAPRA